MVSHVQEIACQLVQNVKIDDDNRDRLKKEIAEAAKDKSHEGVVKATALITELLAYTTIPVTADVVSDAIGFVTCQYRANFLCFLQGKL